MSEKEKNEGENLKDNGEGSPELYQGDFNVVGNTENHAKDEVKDLFLKRFEKMLSDPEHIKKRTEYYTKEAERILKNMFGQDNFSDIEKVKLREIAENTYRQGLEELILIQKKEMLAINGIDVRQEVVYRWLWELYGINRSDIPGESYGNETLNVPEDFREYLRRLRKDSHLI